MRSSAAPPLQPAGRQRTAGGADTLPEIDRLLTIAQAAVVLNVPPTWLRDKVTARQVPHTRLGRHVRFNAAHLAQIVASGEQHVRPEPLSPAAERRAGPRRRPA